jgi:hypothetical protein
MKRSNFIMWMCVAMVAIAALSSCTAQDLEPNKPISVRPIAIKPGSYKFIVEWDSNQEDPYVEFTKHIFKDCKIVSSTMEVHRESMFEIELDANQMFDIQIKKGAAIKNPELYLRISKGDEIQYEQEVNTGGFMMSNFVNRDGNIGN